MATTTLFLEIATGLLFGAAGMAAGVAGAALVLGTMITMSGEQREAPVVTSLSAWTSSATRRYTRLARGSSTSRTASPSTFTARIKPKSAVDAAARFQAITGSRESSSRA
jgi:uncharacterized membrane protein YfcA